MKKSLTIEEFVAEKNQQKFLFTAGPASLLPENLTGLRPCFGRGDDDYSRVEEQVLSALTRMTGHREIARMQGAASLALEMMALNFLYGRVLVVNTGYYSDRLRLLTHSAQRRIGAIQAINEVDWRSLDSVGGHFDWIVACFTETSCGLKLPIEDLEKLAKRAHAKLMLDATASIGLEDGHEKADVIAYSSCKGLFGVTGAAFIAFNDMPTQQVDSFYLDLQAHLDKKMTGPYHSMASLVDVLPRHEEFKYAVRENKRTFLQQQKQYAPLPMSHQPLLCTYVKCEVRSSDPRAVLYRPRGNLEGCVVCHLGEVHLGHGAQGKILDMLSFEKTRERA